MGPRTVVRGLLDYSKAQSSKVHGANMGPTWLLSAPDGRHEPCCQGYAWFLGSDEHDPNLVNRTQFQYMTIFPDMGIPIIKINVVMRLSYPCNGDLHTGVYIETDPRVLRPLLGSRMTTKLVCFCQYKVLIHDFWSCNIIQHGLWHFKRSCDTFKIDIHNLCIMILSEGLLGQVVLISWRPN